MFTKKGKEAVSYGCAILGILVVLGAMILPAILADDEQVPICTVGFLLGVMLSVTVYGVFDWAKEEVVEEDEDDVDESG